MPSVCVSWGATCTSPDVQAGLLADLAIVAARSAARLRGPAPKRPDVLVKMTALRGEGEPELPAVRTWEETVRGQILIGPGLAADPAHAVDEASRLGAPLVATGEGRGLLRLESAHLFGLDFRLFDPRALYPHEDRLSFVFLGCPELPAFDGRIAWVLDHAEAQLYDADAIRAADRVVVSPEIHFRYYLEQWTDQLLALVKYFFIPGLTYWRGETLPGWDEARARYDQAVGCSPRGEAKGRALGVILEWFEREADEWISKMGTW
jgi:hypothetical protein